MYSLEIEGFIILPRIDYISLDSGGLKPSEGKTTPDFPFNLSTIQRKLHIAVFLKTLSLILNLSETKVKK